MVLFVKITWLFAPFFNFCLYFSFYAAANALAIKFFMLKKHTEIEDWRERVFQWAKQI